MTVTGFTGELTLRDGRKVFVRHVRPGDRTKIQDFLNSLGPVSAELFPKITTDEVIDRRIERAMNGDDWVYLAFDGETAVAYFFLWCVREANPLLGICVADAWQDAGLGQQLMAILIDDGRRLDRDGIELTTGLTNDRAFHIYLKMGFQHYGFIENAMADGSFRVERGLYLPFREGAKLIPHKYEMPA
jgi:GNAT superfamily N-acetyltransferase